MSDSPLDAVIAQYGSQLKMPGLVRSYAGLARQARQEGWAYEDFLKQILETEIVSRQDRGAERRIREAKFPEFKVLDQIQWEALHGVSRPQVLELSRCAFVEPGEDIILAGPVGTGKTMIAIGIGIEAARRGYPVLFRRASDLVRALLEARDERQLSRLHAQLERVSVLILDEFGFVPFDRAGGELLFNLLSERHAQARSTIVTTNLSFGEWVQVLGCEKLTTALLDRLSARSHILRTKGPSYRSLERSVGVKQTKDQQVL